MAVLAVAKDQVALCSASNILIYSKSKEGETRRLLDQTLLPIPQCTAEKSGCENKSTSCTDLPEGKRITVCCFCNCGKYFLTCNDDKHLHLWNTSDWSLINSRLSPRRCQQLQFTKDCSLFLVGDKSGDLYRFKTLGLSGEKGEFLLGHLSLLLDFYLTPDEKYIISCDRDEKIRVSHYPNAYNIESYCLGHTEFVTTLAVLDEDNILASGSGDGTIRFWNYKTGSEISCINCSDILSIGEKETRIVTEKLSVGEGNTIAALLFELQSAVLLEMFFDNDTYKLKTMQRIDFPSNVWDVAWDSIGVWFLLATEENPLQMYSKCADDERYEVSSKFDRVKDLVKKDWTYLKESMNVKSVIPTLFKQYYDNMTPYVERKQERIAKKLKTSKNVSVEATQ